VFPVLSRGEDVHAALHRLTNAFSKKLALTPGGGAVHHNQLSSVATISAMTKDVQAAQSLQNWYLPCGDLSSALPTTLFRLFVDLSTTFPR
jgi:hypothetical protein